MQKLEDYICIEFYVTPMQARRIADFIQCKVRDAIFLEMKNREKEIISCNDRINAIREKNEELQSIITQLKDRIIELNTRQQSEE